MEGRPQRAGAPEPNYALLRARAAFFAGAFVVFAAGFNVRFAVDFVAFARLAEPVGWRSFAVFDLAIDASSAATRSSTFAGG
jgi:hypothetical protein